MRKKIYFVLSAAVFCVLLCACKVTPVTLPVPSSGISPIASSITPTVLPDDADMTPPAEEPADPTDSVRAPGEDPTDALTPTTDPADTLTPATDPADALTPTTDPQETAATPTKAPQKATAAPTKAPQKATAAPTKAPQKATAAPTKAPTATPTPKYKAGTILGDAPSLSHNDYFYTKSITVTIKAEKPGKIYYTLDGTEPTRSSKVYQSGIALTASGASNPKASVLRAKAYYTDGSESPTVVHTYLISSSIASRFSTYIFSITGDPADLTKGPNGILYGTNYEKRGRASERAIYVEVLNPKGSLLLGQYAGVRVYGAYSRRNEVKSLKLFARSSYASGLSKFKYNFFNSKDTTGAYVKSYDKLVLRSYGNDWQFGYLRDELNQRLAALAGFPVTEAVEPAVVYLNGSYYNFVWLHESYCNSYFKKHFPASGKNGEFIVLEGAETYKSTDDDADAEEIAAVKAYNKTYAELSSLDLTQDANFAKVKAFLDVENYLDYYALNIYLNNNDWPHNNYKCFRYVRPASESAGTGMYDGRYRFLPHDMDYTLGLYDQKEVKADYNNLADILSPEHKRYAPLFAKLLEREDMRNYFIRRILSLADGALSADSVSSQITKMTKQQSGELGRYIKYLNNTYQCWTNEWSTNDSLQQIRNFANARKGYMVTFLAKAFSLSKDDILALGK